MLTEIKRKQQQKQQKHKNVLIELCVLLSFADKQPGRNSSPSYVFSLSVTVSFPLSALPLGIAGHIGNF